VDAYNKWYQQQTAGNITGQVGNGGGDFATPQQAQSATSQPQPPTPTPNAPLLNSANGTPGVSFSTPSAQPASNPMAQIAQNPAMRMALDPVYHMLSMTNPAAATAYMTNMNPQPVQLARGNQIVDPRTGQMIANNPIVPQAPDEIRTLQALQQDPSLMRAYRQMHPVAPGGGQGHAPTGYRFNPDGTLAPIPGGPADKAGGYNANMPMAMGNPSLTGPDYLKSIDPQYQPMVQAVLQGRQAPPSGSAARSSYWMGILDAANKVDPTFDTTDYQKRYKTAQDFAPSGSSGQQIKALNTLIQHVGGLQGSYQKLNNGGSPMLNSILNKAAFETGLGGKNLKAYELNAHAAAQEVESLWKKGGGNEADIKAYADKLNSSNDPTTEKQVLSKMVELAAGRLQALHSSYQNAMGNSGVPLQLVNDNSLKAMAKINPGLLQEYQQNATAQPSGQLAGPNNPTMPQAAPSPAGQQPSSPPRAVNSMGHAVVWNGTAWVPEQ